MQLELGAESGQYWVEADPGQLERVVVNLATNARDAMPTGGTLGLEVRSVPAGQGLDEASVCLEVSDTGQGMDQATQERIFEPFFTTKERGRGTGLGLSTLYGIVTQSGGRVVVDSTPGQGTTFRVFLPRAQRLPDTDPLPQRPAQRVGGETVLVVEDERLVRTLAERILLRAGYRVLVASSGGEALELVARHRGELDLVLTDVVMPGLSGPELTDRLLQSEPDLRCIWMSGYADDVLATRAGEVPEGIHFLTKPFSPEGLLAKLRLALDGD